MSLSEFKMDALRLWVCERYRKGSRKDGIGVDVKVDEVFNRLLDIRGGIVVAAGCWLLAEQAG